MEPLIGAFVAAVVAWISILVAGRLPGGWLRPEEIRPVGGASLALLGIMVLGVPLPGWIPGAVLAGGLVVVTVLARVRARRAPRAASP